MKNSCKVSLVLVSPGCPDHDWARESESFEIFYVINCWKMHFPKRVKVSSQSHSETRLTNEKCSSNKKHLIRTKKNYLVETIVFNL